jgi:hypothetical protein
MQAQKNWVTKHKAHNQNNGALIQELSTKYTI